MRHPVHLRVERPERSRRIHVLVRLVLCFALGALGAGRLWGVAYLAAPAVVALVVLQRGAGRYLAEDAPRVARGLRWLAGALAYLSLLTDAPPAAAPGPVELGIEPTGRPTVGSALLRLVTSLPALLLVALIQIVAMVCWIVGALCILVVARLPSALADFLTLALRLELRLMAYHLSLVDAYPALAEDAVVHAPT
jgi:hypothetical protein